MTQQSHTLLDEWYLELNTIDQELENAAGRILESCEKLVQTEDLRPETQDLVNTIMENCAFHDLNSQRLRKITRGLGALMNCLEGQGVVVPQHDANAECLASGPQRQGVALTQNDIEKMFKN